MNIDPNKPADKPTEELTEKELEGIAGGAFCPDPEKLLAWAT